MSSRLGSLRQLKKQLEAILCLQERKLEKIERFRLAMLNERTQLKELKRLERIVFEEIQRERAE